MISTLFFGLFSRGTRGHFLTLYNIRNSYIVINTQHGSRIDLQALITVKQALVSFLQYCTEADEHSLTNFLTPCSSVS